VSAETLWAAINVYVLMGVLFAFLYTFVAMVEPAAFTGDALLGDGRLSGQTFIYFSFVTMTTLGFGDITPNMQLSATLVYVQALIGQLYVAIMIARLVALYSTQNNKE
jgi:voltage-gated potassium channel